MKAYSPDRKTIKHLVKTYWKVIRPKGRRYAKKAILGTKKNPTKLALNLMGILEAQRLFMERKPIPPMIDSIPEALAAALRVPKGYLINPISEEATDGEVPGRDTGH